MFSYPALTLCVIVLLHHKLANAITIFVNRKVFFTWSFCPLTDVVICIHFKSSITKNATVKEFLPEKKIVFTPNFTPIVICPVVSEISRSKVLH